MRLPSLSYANVVSSLALFVALGGTSYAVASLPKNSVGDRQLKSGAVSGSKIKSDAVTTSKIKDGSVTAADLAPDAAVSGPRGPRGAAGPIGATGPAGPGAGPAEPWQSLTFVDGWTNYDANGYSVGTFRKDQLGVVQLRGLVSRGTGTPYLGGPIATLPVGYRPKKTRVFSAHTGHGHLGGRIDVQPDGSVVWIAGATGEPNYVSLEGVFFDLD